MTMNATLINRAAFNAFADSVVITIGATTYSRKGIYNKKQLDAVSNRATTYRHTIDMRESDLSGVAIEKNKGHTITHDGVVYTVVGSEKLSGGIIQFVLSQYG